MYVNRQRRCSAHGFDDHRAEREIRDEQTIHDVDVDPVGAAGLGVLDGFGQVTEVGVQDRRRNLDLAAHASTAWRSRCFFSARRRWPHAARMSRPRLTRIVAGTPPWPKRASN